MINGHYESCEECRGLCCAKMSIRIDPNIQHDIRRYLSLRGHFVDSRHGYFLVIDNPCAWLTADGTCSHYDERPTVCRNFNESSMEKYFVPKFCKYDLTGEFGEEF